jgi:HK97 family phage prohead protease
MKYQDTERRNFRLPGCTAEDGNVERRNFISGASAPGNSKRISEQGGTSNATITGTIPYNVLSHSIPSLTVGGRPFREIIRPGAFLRSVVDARSGRIDVIARFEHEQLFGILGRTSNNTLRLFEDSRGLRYEIALDTTTLATDVGKMLRRNDIIGSSFSFLRNPKERWKHERDGTIRELIEVQLTDISPVLNPAYPGTTARIYQQGEIGYMQRRLELAEKVL